MSFLRWTRILIAELVTIAPRKAAVSIVLMLATTVTEGAGVLLLMPLLQLVGIDEQNTMPNVAGWFEAAFEAVGVTPTLGSVLLAFVAFAGLRALLGRSQAWVAAAVREDVTTAVRVRVYRAMAGAEWSFLVGRRQSEFVHVLAGEIGQVGWAASQMIGLAVLVGVSFVYLGLAFHLSRVMAVIVLVCAAVMAAAARGRNDEAKALGSKASKARARLHAAITEHVSSMKTAKSYGAVDRHLSVFVGLSSELRDLNLEVSAGENDLQQSLEFGSTALLAGIVFVSFQVLGITAGQLLVVLFTFARLMPRLVQIHRRIQGLHRALPALDTVHTLERECVAAAEERPLPDLADIEMRRQLRLEGVSFSYAGRPHVAAIADIDLEIPAGLTVAIVGASGAGKSTLVDLLIGLLRPTSGRLLVDDLPLTAEHLAAWRRNLGYVPQDTFLFHDTVRANLEWASPGATDDELWAALRLAAASEFVAAMPNGLDTIVGERGVLVSGGERQRLSLARAVLRRPRVLVLDEATSSLDSETERRIQGAIEGLHHEMTIVIVTHRLSMISGADVIHVLDSGRLVESGSWDELMSREGRFLDLCHAQGIFERPRPVGSPEHAERALRLA